MIPQIVKHIEDVEKEAPKELTEKYTDEQLLQGGLVKVEAFVRSKASATAVRKARQRKKEEAEGLKQVNVTAPAEIKPILQLIAKECSEGKKLEDVIIKAVPSVTSHGLDTPENKKALEIGEKVLKLSRLKKWIVLKLIGG